MLIFDIFEPWLLYYTLIVWFCNCSMFCCALLYVPSSFAIILMGKRESWLLCLVCLPGASWLVCGSSMWCHGFVCSLWLWYILNILTYYFIPRVINTQARILMDMLCLFLPKKYTMGTIGKPKIFNISRATRRTLQYHWFYNWAVTRDFQQYGMCDQQSLRSACAYAQSDQGLC